MSEKQRFRAVGELGVVNRRCRRHRLCDGQQVRVVAYRKPGEKSSSAYAECLTCGHRWAVCGVPRKNGPCTNSPVKNRLRCKYHGGCSVRGQNHHWYRGTSGYDDRLPHHLLRAYETAMADPELTSVRAEISLVYTRMDQLVGRLATGESADAWREVCSTVQDLITAIQEQDKAQVTACIDQLAKLTKRRNRDEEVWDEMLRLMAAKTRLAEHEDTRRAQLEQCYTPDQGLQMVKMVAAAVEAEVTDKDLLARIGQRLMGLLSAERAAMAGDEPPVKVLTVEPSPEDAKPAADPEPASEPPSETLPPIDGPTG
jgi:hypothetical protein